MVRCGCTRRRACDEPLIHRAHRSSWLPVPPCRLHRPRCRTHLVRENDHRRSHRNPSTVVCDRGLTGHDYFQKSESDLTRGSAPRRNSSKPVAVEAQPFITRCDANVVIVASSDRRSRRYPCRPESPQRSACDELPGYSLPRSHIYRHDVRECTWRLRRRQGNAILVPKGGRWPGANFLSGARSWTS